MDRRTFFIVGGSSGIGFEIVNALRTQGDEIYVGSRTSDKLADMAEGNLAALAKEMADLLYVVYGTAVSYGIDMEPVFREVHRSNLSKVGDINVRMASG